MATYQNALVTNDMLPVEIKKPIPLGSSEDDFNVRLMDGGTMEIDGGEWIIGTSDFGSNTSTFVALDTIELKNGASIVTNGNLLTIIVNKFKSENGRIISFTTNTKAQNGSPGVALGSAGVAGHPGDHGGKVTIIVVQDFVGTLAVDLSGQAGGDGGAGVQGAQGAQGAPGKDARDGIGGGCKNGGGTGQQGGIGMPGGNGGDGGVGGAGGFLEIVTIGTKPLDKVQYSFNAIGGAGGTGGPAGMGGPGGPGGSGGHGSVFCSGGSTGAPGLAGTQGQPGRSGLKGADGTALIKNLNLAAIIQLGVVRSDGHNL